MKILVCSDGQRHSQAAMQWAIHQGLTLPAEVTALHVIDPWLKKFYNELYSQGRQRYLDYVDECLQAQSDRVRNEFREMCLAAGLVGEFKVRHGEPLREILKELRMTAPDLLITGGKPLSAWGRFRSRNLPARLEKKAGIAITVITETCGSELARDSSDM
jgi:nucleotide-binding universal stress UspA family protein